MLIILSPAKTIKFDKYFIDLTTTLPKLISKTDILVNHLKLMSIEDLQSLMGISRSLAELNYNRFQSYSSNHNPTNSQPAIVSFMGDVYEGMESWKWSKEDMLYAQERLQILSGFYGILRPLDLIQAHRLEMGTRLKIFENKDLYEFWKDDLRKAFIEKLNQLETDTVLNLASNEYSKAIDFKKLGIKVVTPGFKHLKNNEYKIVSFWAKRARGLMTSFVIQNKITNIEDLEAFDIESYYYLKEISTINNPVFTQVF